MEDRSTFTAREEACAGPSGQGLLTTKMTRKRKKMFAMLWNWNHRFLGTKERGVYLAVRILFRVYCCIGRPSSSWSSRGSGRPKKSVLAAPPPPPFSPTSLALSVGAGSAGCDSSVPPDALFFSSGVLLWCNRPLSERRFSELLLTVNFRVAHRDRCIESSAPKLSPAPPSGDAMIMGSRARPDHPKMRARLAKTGPVAVQNSTAGNISPGPCLKCCGSRASVAGNKKGVVGSGWRSRANPSRVGAKRRAGFETGQQVREQTASRVKSRCCVRGEWTVVFGRLVMAVLGEILMHGGVRRC